jgi:signal transduction histidine kinase
MEDGELDFRLLFEESSEVLLVLLPDAPRFTMVAATNARWRATHTTPETLGRGLFEVFPDNPDDPAATGTNNLRASLERVLETRRPDTMPVQQYDIRGPDGSFEVRYWSPKNLPILSPLGEVLYIIHRVEDVTELVRASEVGDALRGRTRAMEHEVIQRSHELEAAVRELREANAKLAELDRAKTEFFSNVSHEFRTPLTLMLGPLEDELADRIDLPTDRRVRLQTAHRNALRLLKLVNTLLDFSRIEAGRTQARFAPTDLAALTRDLTSAFRSITDQAKLQLMVDCPPLPELVYVDREMWEKILFNLLSNAFKHTFEGSICVSLRWRGEHAELRVSDTGIGIAESELPRLFERFHRVQGAHSRSHEGTGIGLALVKELASLHGGTVRAESTAERGSTFTVTIKAGTGHLPVHSVVATDTSSPTATPGAAYIEEALHWLPVPTTFPSAPVALQPEADRDSRPRILWADDNSDMRQYVARLLGQSYEVLAVPDGQAALEAARAAPPDLVLSDVMMPRLDGCGLLKALRADERTRRLPVILLSARAGEESALEGLDAGADDYLTKPFSAKELLARVRSNLSLAQLRKEWEMKLIQANQELAAAAEAKDRFLATMSHEIRTPLNAVIGMAGLLAESQLSEEQREFANIIRSSSDHLLTVINDILDYSRLESGKVSIEHIPYNVAGVIEEALDIVAVKAGEKNLELAYELSSNVPNTVLGDPHRVRQVLLNFLSNAVKFTEHGEVVVTVSAAAAGDDNTELSFTVRDTGVGLTPEQRDRLFKAFSQADNSISRKFGGTGLGLAISRRLAERMGGRVGVESEAGKGARFSFSVMSGLPAEPLRHIRTNARLSPLARLCVWIVDDNDTNRRILRRQAESWGMIVRDTAVPEEALQWAREGDPCELTILDFKMPGMDGAELAAQLHRLRGGAIRQLMLSSVGGAIDPATAQRIGLHAQLTKPVRHAALFDALVKLSGSRVSRSASTTTWATLPVDLAQRVQLRILVAEDNPTNVKVIKLVMERLGYRIDVAGNGLEVLAALRRQQYDLVLMDVQMPEMNGIEATRQILREWPPTRRPRVIALTGGVMPEERRACLDAGIEDFLNKPLELPALVKALQSCRAIQEPVPAPGSCGI